MVTSILSGTEGFNRGESFDTVDENIVVDGPDDAVAAGPPPHEVLGVAPDADEAVVQAAARARKKETHPDSGGDREAFQRVVEAEEAMLEGEP